MTTPQVRERSSSTKKPFSWLQRLYKKSSSQDNELVAGDDMDLETQRSHDAAPFLGIDGSTVTSTEANEVSSLRPTISTRPPSIAQSTASNAAIHNFEAVTSPLAEATPAHLSHVTSLPQGSHLSKQYAPSNDDNTLLDEQTHDDPYDDERLERKETDASAQGDPFASQNNSEAHIPGKQYPWSTKSSKESSVPSVFSHKTSETFPTVSLFAAPTSIMSSRTGGGPGAQDNASMLTLASSSKGAHRRRTSTDTNCSVRALAPASARASFESSRTGYTDSRRFSHLNPGSVLFLDDVNGSPSRGRPSTGDMTSGRTGLSLTA